MDKWTDRDGQRKVVLVFDVVCKTIKYKYFDDCSQKKFKKKLEEPELDYLWIDWVA